MNVIFSLAAVMMIAAISIYIVLNVGKPAIDSASLASQIVTSESFLKSLDNQINEVMKEGSGSRRVFAFNVQDSYEVSDEEDSIIYEKTITPEVMDYQSSVISGSLAFVSGFQVNCFESDETGDGTSDLVMENPFIKAVFMKVAKASPMAAIRTNETFISLKEKSGGSMINFTNSSVLIDGNSTSFNGTGYTEILKTGYNKPFCIIHMFVNSTPALYDVFYMLYSSSDFIVADVRNIR
ncbi:MAG: hypothetical protein QMD85_01305 [Candidatus Aenigmarchaeota archaeon]|nr:hypothetical protein [Candidatus Aenigmarchaeota archaeon]MDI6722189.1 hypothetical protein [Candidatus Aenigmarchaeota archaeon]